MDTSAPVLAGEGGKVSFLRPASHRRACVNKMTLRSPMKTSMSTLTPTVENEVHSETQGESEVSYASVANKAANDLIGGRIAPVVIDFSCNQTEAYLPWSVLADFIFNELKIRKSEILSLMTSRGVASATARIRTYQRVDVKERFGDCFEFARISGGITWKCVVRGAQRFYPLRYHHVYGEVSADDLAKATAPFAEIKSTVMNEVFEDFHDNRLCGIPNGNMRVLILPTASIPEFIVVCGRKIRISHRDQTRRCFRCQAEDHLKSKCPKMHQLSENSIGRNSRGHSTEKRNKSGNQGEVGVGLDGPEKGKESGEDAGGEEMDREVDGVEDNENDECGGGEKEDDDGKIGRKQNKQKHLLPQIKTGRELSKGEERDKSDKEPEQEQQFLSEQLDKTDYPVITRSRKRPMRTDPGKDGSDDSAKSTDPNDPNIGVRGLNLRPNPSK